MAATAALLNHLISFPKKVQVHFGQDNNKAWESRKAAYAAIIYTDLTANPTKYSNGATHWDGREQAIYSTDKRGISADGEFTDDKSKSKKVKL